VIKALEHHVNLMSSGNSQTDFKDESGLNGKIPFTLQEQTHIYTISLELLSNLKKYAKFKYLKVTVEKDRNILIIDFMHNGIGIDNNRIKKLTENSTGIGLKSIGARVLMLNGSLNYTMDEHTACVTLKVPIKNETTN
jgi:signal transduction histidine kinase